MIPHLDGYHPPGCTCHPCVDSQPKPVRHRWARTWVSTGPRRGPNGCSPEPCDGIEHIFRTITRFTFCVRCNLPYRLFIGGNTR